MTRLYHRTKRMICALDDHEFAAFLTLAAVLLGLASVPMAIVLMEMI